MDPAFIVQIRDSRLQVLPLSEESQSNGTDDLLRLEDVRVEVMRARGAGGQVRLPASVLSPF